MGTKSIPIHFHKVLQSRAYTLVILGNATKQFSIYMDAQVGKDIQLYLRQGKKKRPSSHNLIQSILRGHRIRPLHILFEDVKDSIYFAKLFLESGSDKHKKIVEIDARPSDCILLALLSNIPMYCKEELLEKAATDF